MPRLVRNRNNKLRFSSETEGYQMMHWSEDIKQYVGSEMNPYCFWRTVFSLGFISEDELDFRLEDEWSKRNNVEE